MRHLISVPQGVIPHFHHITGLPENEWFVGADPNDGRIGSGGGTAHLLASLYASENSGTRWDEWLEAEKRMIIHAGGKSRRLPSYAPVGKSLMPVPVFRWSRGQQLNQRLIHMQTPLLEEILESAPASMHTMVASGDVLITRHGALPEIPEADIVCFGLWISPEIASRHGVFFAPIDHPGELAFMLQKPFVEVIQQYVDQCYFTMDIGIWLFSSKAMNLLMGKSGWDGEKFRDGMPLPYDLYGGFGPALGKTPQAESEEINSLKVALVNLDGGQFFHFGTNRELISSNESLQNQVVDQREIWHKKIKLHPSVFILNSPGDYQPGEPNENLWIENSHVHSKWQFEKNHVITGIPENNWKISLPGGACLDMVMISGNRWAVRNYGYEDSFSGHPGAKSTRFMNEPLHEWLKKRGLSSVLEGSDIQHDIQSLGLFPEVYPEADESAFIKWLVDSYPVPDKDFTDRWLQGQRWSADRLNEEAAIGLMEATRTKNRFSCLPLIGEHLSRSIFYQLDLEDLAREFVASGHPVPDSKSEEHHSFRPVHKWMFQAHVKRLRGQSWEEEERKAFDQLRESILETVRGTRQVPKINLVEDQITWARSPVRLDLAGGWSDTPPYCNLYGGQVVNMAAELNGQPPLQCYIRRIPELHIVLRSIDLGAEERLFTYDDIRAFRLIGSAFSIPRAALALSGFLPEFCATRYDNLPSQLSDFGSGLEISILSAVPKGSGLGTSSILAATVLGALSETCSLGWSKAEIGKQTLALEQLLTTGGGWQDQFGGILEGVKYLETSPGYNQVPFVRWLPDTLFTKPENTGRILLYYTGITRVAKTILNEIVRGMFLNSSARLPYLHAIREHGLNTFNLLQTNNCDRLADAVRKSWILNQKLDSGTNTPEIRQIIAFVDQWVSGLKLLGAGGGGYMLIIAKDAEAAVKIKESLTAHPPNQRARFVSLSLSNKGLEITKS